MKNFILSVFAFSSLTVLSLTLTTPEVQAQPQSVKLEISNGEDIGANLRKIDNKVVTVILHSEKELTGKVYNVTDKLLHLIDLSAKDYYDAVIKIDSIQAIIVKARG